MSAPYVPFSVLGRVEQSVERFRAHLKATIPAFIATEAFLAPHLAAYRAEATTLAAECYADGRDAAFNAGAVIIGIEREGK